MTKTNSTKCLPFILATVLVWSSLAQAQKVPDRNLVCSAGKYRGVSIGLTQPWPASDLGIVIIAQVMMQFEFAYLYEMACDRRELNLRDLERPGAEQTDKKLLSCVAFWDSDDEPTRLDVVKSERGKIFANWRNGKMYGGINMQTECEFGVKEEE